MTLSISSATRAAPSFDRAGSTRPPWVLLVPAIAAAFLVLILSSSLVVTPDSTVYLATAESVESGHGLRTPFVDSHGGFDEAERPTDFTRPLTQFPPAYPMILGLGAEVMTPFAVGRAVNVVSVAIVIGVAGWLTIAAGATRRAAVVTQCVMVASFWFLETFTALLTEGPFLAAVAILVVLLIRMSGRAPLAWEVGVITVLLAFTGLLRYAGLGVVVGVGGLGLLLARRDGARQLWLCVAAGCSLVPIAIWLATRGSGVGNRVVSFHPRLNSVVTSGLETVGRWLWPELLPIRLVQLGGALTVVVVGALTIWLLRRAQEPERRVAEVVVVIVGAYVAMVAFSQAFLDRTITLDRRHLALLFALGAPVVAAAGHAVWTRLGRRPVGHVAVVVLVGLQLVNVVDNYSDETELDYHRAALMEGIEEQVAMLDPEVPIYSDRSDLVWWATGRPSGSLPVEYVATSGLPNAELDAELAVLQGDRHYVVFVGAVPDHHLSVRSNFVVEDRVAGAPGIRLLSESDVATVYETRG